MSVQLGQHAPARHTVAHFSDPHLLSGGRQLYGRVPTDENLAQALLQLERTGLNPTAIVFTGDLTDLGEPDAYRRLRDAVDPVAERLGSTVIWLMGNHDERPAMRSVMLDEVASEEPVDRVWDFDGLRFIGLDTSVPGYHHGELTTAQLRWLDSELSKPAPHGTIIGLHHPPIPAPQPIFDILELREQSRFADVVRGRDVRAILGGHLHYSSHGTFAGIPVSVAAATCYTMNLSMPQRAVNGMAGGQAFNLVHVYEDTIVHSVVPLGDHAGFDSFTDEFITRLEQMTPDQRVEAFSRKR
ncbi:3',5'-cyclic AMP phosphodiesterase CpdA [Paramicrobacterium humi]|uniref:3',5'-cyclic AMP phosphodiesterase CpdA n=1 Tax=Paramicrobacterium humi TaxID=640635 RepID=A0A1H4PLV1_9MICO|nr:phosphodiesterase [Microbacterium humi]SEC08416.1 3',5'-cyclic AMP phosphodiesterase CpdA [Microbacterium humi]